jgi:hypothetical protein
MSSKDIYYVFLEEQGDKCVIEIVNDFDWQVELYAGNELVDMNYHYDNKLDIDDIMDNLRSKYEYVEEISLSEIDDYMC